MSVLPPPSSLSEDVAPVRDETVAPSERDGSPLLRKLRDSKAPSVFKPENLLREGRRQRGLPEGDVPEICVLDPDGDLMRLLRHDGRGRLCPGWACYHSELFEFDLANGGVAGVIGCAVGASYAVLVAEQLFASGCRLLISITSAGLIADLGDPPYVVLIERALRDEGTSAHYLPLSDFASAPDAALLDRVESELRREFPPECSIALHRGATWTTDAPYRETEPAIAAARSSGALAVEMEAAALYAFGTAKRVLVVCFAHVTNSMAQHGVNDFEKGEGQGTVTALRLIEAATRAFRSHAQRRF
jgi:uridine phosphorylase